MIIEMMRAKPGLVTCIGIFVLLPSCSSVLDATPHCSNTKTEFRYSGAGGIYINIEELSTGINLFLGSKEEEIYLSRNLSKDGLVFNGWFAITHSLLQGEKFEDFSTACQGFEIQSNITFVACKPGSTGGAMAYTFERGRGVTQIWWNGEKESLVELEGNCGLGSGLG